MAQTIERFGRKFEINEHGTIHVETETAGKPVWLLISPCELETWLQAIGVATTRHLQWLRDNPQAES